MAWLIYACFKDTPWAYSNRFLLLLWLFFPSVLLAQDTLPVVTVSALPLRNSMPGERVEQWNAASVQRLQHLALADLLARESGLYVRSYGLGSLATLSARGSSSGQTAVTWNGLPVQSPMLGLLDAALLPAAFTDGLSIRYGGNSTQWGSGAVGGVVALHNQRPELARPWQVRYSGSGGSFGMQSHLVGLATQRRQWASHTRLLFQAAENDFPYRKKPDLPMQRQTNAQYAQTALLQEFYCAIGTRQEIALRVWGQSTDRSIAPLTTQTRNVATQADDFVRTALHWKATMGRASFAARAAYFKEWIDYRDPAVQLIAKSHFDTRMAEVEAQWQMNSAFKLHGGTFHSWQRATAEGYRGVVPVEERHAVFAALRWERKFLQTQINGRQEWVDGKHLPLMPGAGITIRPFKQVQLHGKLIRNFRTPTLNDRYWRPGGNPALLPESGWSQEIGLEWQFLPYLRYSCTAYHRLIHNWILWSVAEGQSFWSSNNITRVQSRGIEQRAEYRLAFGNGQQLNIKGGYDLTHSVNRVALRQPFLEAGQQMWYIPVHQGFFQLLWQYRCWEAGYTHRFTGRVQGINEVVPGFDLGFASLQYRLRREKQPKVTVQVFIQADNVWNRTYRVVERRPMPGIAGRAGGSVTF